PARIPGPEMISVLPCKFHRIRHAYWTADAVRPPLFGPPLPRCPDRWLPGGRLPRRRAADSRGGFQFGEEARLSLPGLRESPFFPCCWSTACCSWLRAKLGCCRENVLAQHMPGRCLLPASPPVRLPGSRRRQAQPPPE